MSKFSVRVNDPKGFSRAFKLAAGCASHGFKWGNKLPVQDVLLRVAGFKALLLATDLQRYLTIDLGLADCGQLSLDGEERRNRDREAESRQRVGRALAPPSAPREREAQRDQREERRGQGREGGEGGHVPGFVRTRLSHLELPGRVDAHRAGVDCAPRSQREFRALLTLPGRRRERTGCVDRP